MSRVDDWPERLAAHIEAARGRPFVWGAHDCCAYAADWVLAATGTDPIAPWRGYTDAREGMRRLADLGGIAGLWTRLFGAPIAPYLAQRGDLVRVMVDGRESTGVVIGAHAAAPGETDLALAPMATWLEAWRV